MWLPKEELEQLGRCDKRQIKVQGMEKPFKYLDSFSNGVKQVGFQDNDFPITGIVQAKTCLLTSQEYCREDSCGDTRLNTVLT